MIVPYAVLLHMRYGVTPIFMGYVRICKTVHTVSPPLMQLSPRYEPSAFSVPKKFSTKALYADIHVLTSTA